MDQQTGYFRTAKFGGFQKSDVLAFIEEMTRKHQDELAARESEQQTLLQQVEELSRQLEQCRARNAEWEQRHADTLEKLGDLTMQQQKARQQHEEDQQWKEKVQQGEEELAQLRQQLQQMTEERDALREEQKTYLLAKEKLPEIELCAYRRAQEIEQQALEEAKGTRLQSAELLLGLKQKLEPVHQQSQVYLQQVEQELQQLQARASDALAGLSQIIESLDEVMVSQLAQNTPDAPDTGHLCSLSELIDQVTRPKPETEEDEHGAV